MGRHGMNCVSVSRTVRWAIAILFLSALTACARNAPSEQPEPAGTTALPQSSSVQDNYANSETVTVAYKSAQKAGNLNVVVVGWHDTTAVVTSVTDTTHNTYALAVGPTTLSGYGAQSIYYATNIAAGTNTVTVTLNKGGATPDVRVVEWSNLNTTSPLDATAASTGSSATSSSGAVKTTNASDVLIASNLVKNASTGAESGWTSQTITTDGDILESKNETATGSYTATAALKSSGSWIMQVVALKAASGKTPTFVQVASSTTATTSLSSVAVPYTTAQNAGDLNVVVVGWKDASATVSSVTDTKGNAYALAVGPTVIASKATQSIYYAKNIVAAAANANTVTVKFS